MEDKEPVSIEKWKKKFAAAERTMKDEFFQKYVIARMRLRSEYQVLNRNTKKMTHNQVNLVYSIGTALKNSVYFKSPNCNLKARDNAEHEQVENTEIKVNDILKDKKVKKSITRNIWDAFLGGFGCVYTDYVYNDMQGDQVIGEQINPETGLPEPIFNRIVVENEIIVRRIRPDMVRFPKGFDFDNFQESPWMGFDVIMALDEAKEMQNWDEEVRGLLKGEKYEALSNFQFSDSKKTNPGGSEDLYVKISYCFIRPAIKGQPFELLVFSKESEKPLLREAYDKGHIGYPLKFLVFNPIDDDYSYPNGDPWIFESQLSAIDTWWRQYGKHVKSCNPKTIYDQGVVTGAEIQKVKTDNDLEYVGIKNASGKPLGDLFFERTRPQLNQDVTNYYQVARQLLSEISPKSGLSRGAEDANPDTATEAKIIQTGDVIDVEARIDDVADFIKDIVLDIAGILTKIQATMPVKKMIPDEQGVEQEIVQDIGADGFTNSINVDVDVESMQAQNKEVYRRQLLDTMGVLSKIEPLMNKNGQALDWTFFIRELFDSFNIRNIDKAVIPFAPAMPVPVPAVDGSGVPPQTITGAVDPLTTELSRS